MGMFSFTIENSTFPSVRPWKNGVDYWSSFELYPEWTGKTFYVFKGMAYHQNDYWSGTMVAVKTFRHVEGTADDWLFYKKRSGVARKMAAEFNRHLTSITCNTRLNFVKPIDAAMKNISDIMKITRFLMRYDKKFSANEVVLFEDLLEGDFKTFVKSHGSTTGFGSEILDAFCHFTYHSSGENLVVCCLKGVEEEGEYMLTNPTIHSQDGRYGDKDKRNVGISDFFKNHVCNALCEQFLKPGETLSVETFDVEASAPDFSFMDDTSCKASEANEEGAFQNPQIDYSKPICPPKYSSADPLGPPPYTST